MPVVQRPEFARVPLRAFDEGSLLVATRVAHWPLSLCGFKRAVLDRGYEFVRGPWMCAHAIIGACAQSAWFMPSIHSMLWISSMQPLHLLWRPGRGYNHRVPSG